MSYATSIVLFNIGWQNIKGGIVMKKLIASFLAILSFGLGINVYAGCTSNTIGGTTFYNCDDGTSGTANNIGGTTFFNFNNGTSGTSNNIGGTTFHHFNDGTSGTSNRIGGTTFHNFNDGLSGTSNRISDADYRLSVLNSISTSCLSLDHPSCSS